MWPFKSAKRHLKYSTVWEWKEKEGVPDDFFRYHDTSQRDRWITEYGELRQHLFEKHIKTLTPEEQQMFREKRHPSQSHSFSDGAKPYCESLAAELKLLGIIFENIELGFYQMDRIILCVNIDPQQKIVPVQLPWLHRGFEIKFYFNNPSPILNDVTGLLDYRL